MSVALRAPASLRDGDVMLVPLDSAVPALLVAASHDAEITRWTQVPAGMTLLDAGLVVAGWASNPSVVRLQICLPDLGPAGMVTVWLNAAGDAEIGYWLLHCARGRAAARRSVWLLCEWTFATCDIDELQLTTLPGNDASERVALACGFRSAGIIERDVKGSRRTVRLWVRRRDPEAPTQAR